MKVAKQKRTGGFTLIELIVVIAILGILAGVGTVAYTGYIKAARKGVDEQLISDVAYSMYLASYADPNFLEGEAYVVGLQYNEKPSLTAVGESEDTTKLKSALEMSFGTGCTENGTLQLTYDGWKLGAVTGVLSLVDSSYHGKEEQLLGDIQTFTDSLEVFLGDSNDSRLNMVLNSENSDYAKYLNSVGATTSQEVANATTLYLAQYAASKSDPEQYASWWASGLQGEEEYVPSELWESAQKFNNPEDINAYDATGDIMMFYAAKVAAAEASYQYVTSEDGPDDTLKEKFDAIRQAEGLSSLMTAVTNFNLEIKDKHKTSYQDWCDSQAAQDAKAYIQCLNAINESSDSFTGNLSQPGGQGTGLYADGTALSMVTSYVSTAQALKDAELDENSAAVAITVCKDSNGKIMVTVYKNGKATAADNGSGGEDNIGNVTTVSISGYYTYDDTTGETWNFGNTTQTLEVGDTVDIQVSFNFTDYGEVEDVTIEVFGDYVEAAAKNLIYDSSVLNVNVSLTKTATGATAHIAVTRIAEGSATISSGSESVANYTFN